MFFQCFLIFFTQYGSEKTTIILKIIVLTSGSKREQRAEVNEWQALLVAIKRVVYFNGGKQMQVYSV